MTKEQKKAEAERKLIKLKQEAERLAQLEELREKMEQKEKRCKKFVDVGAP